MNRKHCAADDCNGIVGYYEDGEKPPRSDYCTIYCRPSNKSRGWKAYGSARRAEGLRVSRQHQHGLTDEAFQALKARGKCDACSTTEPGHKNGWAIDHDHLCCPGAKGCPDCIRGLLCHGCNMALGAIKDDANRLLDLYAYLYRDQGMPVPKFQEALNGA